MDRFLRYCNNHLFDTKGFSNLFELNNNLPSNIDFTNSLKLFQQNIRRIFKNIDILINVLIQIQHDFYFIVLNKTFKVVDLTFSQLRNYDLIYNEGNISR